VVRDTPQKRGEYMPTMTVTIPVPARVTVQEAQEILSGVQQTLDVRRIALDPQKRVIVLRDQVLKADAARKLISDLMLHRPQVALEIDLLFTGRTKQQTLGFTVPTSTVLMYLTDTANGVLSLPMAVDRILKSSNYLALGLTGAEFFASLTRTSATSLSKSQLVALDGMPSTIHIGDRYPIQSNVFIGDRGQGGEVFTPPPQITFEELGTVIKVTPTVHGMDEVTLEIEAEFKQLGSGSFNGIPVITNRKYQGRVRVRNGEVAVLGGLVSFSRSEVRTGLPWLAELPYVGILFRRDTKDETLGDTLITVTPRVMSLPPGETALRPLWIGSETHPVTVY
jgi:general secretion pathway protein D